MAESVETTVAVLQERMRGWEEEHERQMQYIRMELGEIKDRLGNIAPPAATAPTPARGFWDSVLVKVLTPVVTAILAGGTVGITVGGGETEVHKEIQKVDTATVAAQVLEQLRNGIPPAPGTE